MAINMSNTLTLSEVQTSKLKDMLTALLNQEQASVIVPAQQAATGFWFGGGNLIETPDGSIWISGRYRNFGDSRTGLGSGQRGLECAIFQSKDRGKTFDKVLSFSKADLSVAGREVVSIEGTALHIMDNGHIELFISTEKTRSYPKGLESFQKPGTGVWSIDRISSDSVETLSVDSIESVLENFDRPEYLHVKDPVVFDTPDGGTALAFCTHPFTWSSSNTGVSVRPAGASTFETIEWDVAKRGAAWDVAATRITNRLAIPTVGVFADLGDVYAYFYDGAECLRQLDENPRANNRPRGYSCEEIGGAFVGDAQPSYAMQRLSLTAPLFVSPYGTGSSRYVSTIVLDEGILATWQQSQTDHSQPLVSHLLTNAEIEDLLKG
ncbi:MAG: hypothetical protein Phog2KO_19220 [Phototrophicaceae bacterium]